MLKKCLLMFLLIEIFLFLFEIPVYADQMSEDINIVDELQDLIDMLPDVVAVDNMVETIELLTAIDQERLRLTDDELRQIDFSKYASAVSVINILQGQPGVEVPMTVMQIFLKISEGTYITLEVEPTDRVEDVKAKIFDRTGVTVENQILTFAGKLLANGNTLQDYSVQKDSTICFYTIDEVLTEIPKFVVFIAPQIEVALPGDALPEQIDFAENMANSWREDASCWADFSEVMEAAEQIGEDKLLEALENLHISLDDAAVYVCPYLDIKILNVKLSETGSDESPEITLDVLIKYDLIVSKEAVGEFVTSGEHMNAAVLNDEAMIFEGKPETGVEILLPLPQIFNDLKDSIFIEDTQDSEKVFYYSVSVNGEDIDTFMKLNGLGQFTLIADPRTVVVDYHVSEGAVAQDVYDVTAINTAEVPKAIKEGYRFIGWNYVGVTEETYTGEIVGEDLFDALYEAFNLNSNQPVVATPVFIRDAGISDGGDDSSEDDIAEEAKNTEADSEEVFAEAAEVEAVRESVGRSVPPATGDAADVAVYVMMMVVAMVMPFTIKKV